MTIDPRRPRAGSPARRARALTDRSFRSLSAGSAVAGHGESAVAGHGHVRRVAIAIGLVAALAVAPPLGAQPMTERSPNLEGTWTTPPHSLHFQLSHRFEMAGSDVDISDLFGADGKVVNYPTFSLTYGLFEGGHLGVRYSSNSALVGQANEWQPYAKVAPLRGAAGGRLSLAATGAYNAAAESFDGELALQADLGNLRLIAAGRGFSNPFDRPAVEEEAEFALAGGAVLKLNRYVSLSGDYANMITQSDAQIAWSAGAAIAIPSTPHTLAFFATNVTSGTLQGQSVGIDGATYWGFEFTVPFTGPRWGLIFDPPPAAPAAVPAATPAPPSVTPTASETGDPAPEPATPAEAEGATPPRLVEIEIANVNFATKELEIAPGTTVRWINRDPLAHTTTSNDGLWNSPLIEKDGYFEYTFEASGRFEYYCMPHPFMKGVIIVTDGVEEVR